MSEVKQGLKYTKDHEWIAQNGDEVTVGITDYAQAALGDLAYVELPEVGSSFSKGDEFAVVESVKTASEVYAPVSGEVVAVNEALADSPELINSAPYEGGWIAKIKLTNASEIEEAMSPNDYKGIIE